MKLNYIVENTSRRLFLKKGIMTAFSANPLLNILSTSGVPSTVITGLKSGGTVPFLITVVTNHGRGLPPKLSHIFNNIKKAAALSSRLSDSGLITGSDDNFSIGGLIGIEKLASIAKAASIGTKVELAGRNYIVSDYDDAFVLDALDKSSEPSITIYKDLRLAPLFPPQADPDNYEKLTENPIKAVWDNYLKYGGSTIDKAAEKLIKDLNLDMSQYFLHDDNVSDVRDAYHDQDNKRESEANPIDDKKEYTEYHGAMHQMYDSYDNKLNIVLDSVFYNIETI